MAESVRTGNPANTLTSHGELRSKVASPGRLAVRRFFRHRLAVTGTLVLLIITLLAIFAPVVTQHSPSSINLAARSSTPTVEHWFGTDRTGRDTFSRTVYAGRVSLAVGILAVVLALAIGALLGAISGFFGGFIDALIMRITDVAMTFPPIIIILTAAAIIGPGIVNTILIIGFLTWPIPARLVRSKFLAVREEDYILAARAIGASRKRIITVHAFPSVIDVLVVFGTLGVAMAILLEAGLSFLGFGVQPPTPSWGNMLNVARNISVLENQPWQWIPAGTAIMLTVLTINFIGDGLRDALDPRMKL